MQRLIYFRLNCYAAYDAKGFPVGAPVESHVFNAPESAVSMDGPTMFAGASLDKAATFARNLGYVGKFGIQQMP